MTQKNKILLVSVGGSPQPIIHSLNEQKPDYIVYFCSRDSRSIVRQQIEPKLAFRPVDHDIIVTPDEQNLLISVKVLMEKLPLLLKDWSLTFSSIVGDYTGGTKTMSAAVVLALSGKGCPYSYVGGTERNKQGLGVVIDGREQMLRLENPWDVLAIDSLREIKLLFNRCRFRMVESLAKKIADRTTLNKSFFQALQDIASGFYLWDNFQYRSAFKLLRQGSGKLRPFVDGHLDPQLKQFYQQMTESLARLEEIQKDMALFKSNPSRKHREEGLPADGRMIITDLLANAVRRAEIEYKYDDAIARLYSAIEKMAKVQLKVGYGLDNSNLDLDKIPVTLHQELQEHYSNPRNNKIQIPLGRSYALLDSLNDPLGASYLKLSLELEKVLGIRNMSLLAHGFDPVTEETYKKLLAIALSFIAMTKDELPCFPQLNWSGDFL